MKVVFNLLRSLAATPIGAALVLLSVLCLSQNASAQASYFTPRTLLAEFFPRSQAVTFQRFELTPDQSSRLSSLLGYPLRKPNYTIYIAKTGEQIDGYAIIDEEKGQHLPITFAVQFSPQGAVLRQEVMVYRERYGDEIRDQRFRGQFVGKNVKSALREGEEVIAVSGATVSSRAMVVGVRRALVLLDELMLKPLAKQPAGSPTKATPSS